MHGDKDKSGPKTLTILLPGGSLPSKVLRKVDELTEKYSFDLYLSTAQNLRLYNIAESDLASIKDELTSFGARLKGPGMFPLPRICIGNSSCNLGQIDIGGDCSEHIGLKSGRQAPVNHHGEAAPTGRGTSWAIPPGPCRPAAGSYNLSHKSVCLSCRLLILTKVLF